MYKREWSQQILSDFQAAADKYRFILAAQEYQTSQEWSFPNIKKGTNSYLTYYQQETEKQIT